MDSEKKLADNIEQVFEEKTGINFNKFYNKYLPKLIWFAQNIVQDVTEAEDLANEAFIKSLHKIEMYDPNYNFSTWLFTMTRKMAIESLKRKKRKLPTSSIDEVDNNGKYMWESIADISDEDADIDVRLIKKSEVMMKNIEKLDEKYRIVIELREIEDLSYNDIADLLGLNLSTMKSQLRQARLLLQGMVKDEFEMIEENY